MEAGNNYIFKEDISRLFDSLRGHFDMIPADKKSRLNDVAIYLRSKLKSTGKARILFVSPFDSNLGHIGQIWAKTESQHLNLNLDIFTGSKNEHNINPYALTAIRNHGFDIKKVKSGAFPVYSVKHSDALQGIKISSMPLQEVADPSSGYVALIINQQELETPLLKHAEFRFPLTYDIIPKEPEQQKYERLFRRIGIDMLFIFSRIRES